ncbi:hypothetical protein [Alkalibacillus aidingensis]|uniref:hypothetical protein n=1 Tax=Alkalibacillus aidingensis TaxID=2747607 RepID=UPI0016601CE1|nr:hypothetical protein [Alkalibacillus aidingensis]
MSERFKKGMGIVLIFSFIIAVSLNPSNVMAYPNNQEEFEEYLDSIGYPQEVNGQKPSIESYEDYEQIVYG